MVPAAGLGRRLQPVTIAVPKEMFPIGRYPAIEWVLAEAVAGGCTRIAVITSPQKKVIESYFTGRLANRRQEFELSFFTQDEPAGLADAILQARGFLGDQPFAVLLPDDLFAGRPPLSVMAGVHARTGGCVIAIVEEPAQRASQYGHLQMTELEPGVFELDAIGERGGRDEEGSVLAGLGRYILSPAFLDYAASLSASGVQGELDDAVVLRAMLKANEPIHCVKVCGRRFDISTAGGFVAAWRSHADRSPDWSHR